jgi:hypothetical protein
MFTKSLLYPLARCSLSLMAVMAVSLNSSHAQHNMTPAVGQSDTGPIALPLVLNKGKQGWTFPAGASLAEPPDRKGVKSLQLFSSKKDVNPSASRKRIAVEPGQRYRVSYEARGGEGSAEVTGFQIFRVYAAWPVQGYLTPQAGVQWVDAFEGWHKRSFEFTIPSEAPMTTLDIVAELKGPGKIWLDQFAIEKIPALGLTEVKVTLTSPAYRNLIFADQPFDAIKGSMVIGNREVTSVRLTLTDGKKEFASARIDVSPNSGEQPFSLAVKELPLGDYQLKVTGLRANGSEVESKALTLRKLEREAQAVTVGTDKVLRINGKPFFPIGLWMTPQSNRQFYEISQAGFNVFRTPLSQAALDKASQYNLKVLADVRGVGLLAEGMGEEELQGIEAKQERILGRFSKHSALLAYLFHDEPLWVGIPLNRVQWSYEAFRRNDPFHPVFINEAPRNTIEELAPYGAASDIFGVDIYPVPMGNSHSEMDDKTLRAVGKYTDKSRATVEDRKPIWMTLQAFAWLTLNKKGAKGIYPTWIENRFMAYNALVHGAQGILYYGAQTINEPEYWNILLRTTAELRDLSAVLVEPTIEGGQVKVESSAIAFLHKQHAGTHYLIAINESDEPVKARFQTPFGSQTVHVHFEDRVIAAENGELVDDFKPWEVHVYSDAAVLPPPLVVPPSGVPMDGESFQERAKILQTSLHFESNANWIWSADQKAGSNAWFRRGVDVEGGLVNAQLLITADDFYQASLNGKKVGEDTELSRGGWESLEVYDLTDKLRVGRNLLAVKAGDNGLLPCGLLAELQLHYKDGRTERLLSDNSWRVAMDVEEGWDQATFDDARWEKASIVAPYGGGAWKKNLEVIHVGN